MEEVVASGCLGRKQVRRAIVKIIPQGDGGRILDPPRECDYRPGYYSVFFADPDGIKIELVHS